MVFLKEVSKPSGFLSCLFEELEPYDKQIAIDAYEKWLQKELEMVYTYASEAEQVLSTVIIKFSKARKVLKNQALRASFMSIDAVAGAFVLLCRKYFQKLFHSLCDIFVFFTVKRDDT